MSKRFKTTLIWCLLVGVTIGVMLVRNRPAAAPVATLKSEDALKLIDGGGVVAYRMSQKGLELMRDDGELVGVQRPIDQRVYEHLDNSGAEFLYEQNTSPFSSLLPWLVPLVVLLIFLFVFLRRTGGGQMKSIFDLKNSKLRQVNDADKAKFEDIGGNREAVELLSDIIDYLRNPKRWKEAGTRLPRGVLMVGPPGTGKTLMACAAAGETNAAFLYLSAAEFVELFVGVGAVRVRDTFEKAAAQQPAIVFIDEIDAIGRRRGSGVGTMHEEREQTLNQLLVLMDGLEHFERLVVMAATNRPDILDPALLRPGRFDRMLRLELPKCEERVAILKIHTRKKTLDGSVSLEQIAKKTDGFSGAALEALTNDAALLAVRRTREQSGSVVLTSADFDRALTTMTKSNPQFDQLDSVLVESVTQFAEPTGRAIGRFTLTTGSILEGTVIWMNAAHIKLRTRDGAEVIVAKEMVEQIVPLEGTEVATQGDFTPDRWAERSLDAG